MTEIICTAVVASVIFYYAGWIPKHLVLLPTILAVCIGTVIMGTVIFAAQQNGEESVALKDLRKTMYHIYVKVAEGEGSKKITRLILRDINTNKDVMVKVEGVYPPHGFKELVDVENRAMLFPVTQE